MASLVIVSCNSDDEATVDPNSTDGTPLTAGSADFSKYVALGDSFAAGFSDNALFAEGQKNAYPNIIATQFALVGGGEFTTPFMADNIGGLLLNGNVINGVRLYFNGSTPVSVSGTPTTEVTNHLSGSFNNFGIPGAKSFHLIAPNYGNIAGLAASPATANPYFVRFSSSSSVSVLDDALAQNPTFFSLWIGGNDELGYATAGGDPLVNPLTPQATFDYAYNMIVSGLATNGRKGVIANLPSVTTLPHFHVIKYNQLTQANLTINGVNMISALNAQLYGPLHNALAFLGQGDRINLLSTTGNNPMLMVDETLPNLATQLTAVLQGGGLDATTAAVLGQVFGQTRQTKSTDLIPLSASSRIGQLPSVAADGVASPVPSLLGQLGITFPLPDRYVLIPSEVAEIEAATEGYNATIEAAANTHGLALVNAKELMNQLNTIGITANNYLLTTTFVTGGMFSLDGIHPSPRGYALIANEFLKAINAKYGSNFKGVNVGTYRILYPQNPDNF